MRALTALAALGAIAVAALPTLAHADDAGRIVFVRGGALFSQASDGSGSATELAKLPDGAVPIALAENATGSLLTVDLGAGAVWLVAGEAAVRDGGGLCKGRARPSPLGDCVICPGATAPLMLSDLTTGAGAEAVTHELPTNLSDVGFLGQQPPDLAAMADDGSIVAFQRREPAERRQLAKPGVTDHLLVSPDGTRAVAVFGIGDAARVYSFVLDGEGVPRRIGGPGIPVAWSWDSTWVLIQEGATIPTPDSDDPDSDSESLAPENSTSTWLLAAPKRQKDTKKKKKKKKEAPQPPAPTVRACAVRAVGGESKCWDNYTPVSFSPNSALVLLAKDSALHIAKIAGVRPEKPKKIIENAGPALWGHTPPSK